ncbi:MAG TPA: methyltransferase [Opitutaceae bacterium]
MTTLIDLSSPIATVRSPSATDVSSAHASAPTSPSPDHILQVGTGFWASKTLLAAVELEVFTHLARRPASLEELQVWLGLHPRSARDFLDALVALGFLVRADGLYANTASTDLFLDKYKASYIGGILEMANARLYGFWNNLTEGLRTGEPQNEAKGGGEEFFAKLYAEPARLRQFLQAMTGVSRGANLAIAAKFPWEKYRTFVDVGTAQGDLAMQVALANPHLCGLGFDLPQAGPIFRDYAAQLGLEDRVRFAAGNFFEQALPRADVIMMGHILHDWNLAEKKRLVRAAWEALPAGGAFIVYDSIIDDERRRNAFGLLMSLNMLIETPGGFDYTGADCQGWMSDAGFRETYVQHLVGPDSMVVGIK